MKEGIDLLWEIGRGISARPAEIDYGAVFLGMAELEPVGNLHRQSEPSTAQYRAFRAAARRIATDLHALKCARDGPAPVSENSSSLREGQRIGWTKVGFRMNWVDGL